MLAMRNATVHRYELLPFLYTLFARAAILNEPPIRPLFMVYVYLLLQSMNRHILKFLLFISIHHLVSHYSLTTKNHIIYCILVYIQCAVRSQYSFGGHIVILGRRTSCGASSDGESSDCEGLLAAHYSGRRTYPLVPVSQWRGDLRSSGRR